MAISANNRFDEERKVAARATLQRELFASSVEGMAMKIRIDSLWRLNQLLSNPGAVAIKKPRETQKRKAERRKLLDDLGYETYDPETAIEGIRQGILLEVFSKARLISDRYDMIADTATVRMGSKVGIRLEDGRFDPGWTIAAIRSDGRLILEHTEGEHDVREIPIENLLETMTGRVI